MGLLNTGAVTIQVFRHRHSAIPRSGDENKLAPKKRPPETLEPRRDAHLKLNRRCGWVGVGLSVSSVVRVRSEARHDGGGHQGEQCRGPGGSLEPPGPLPRFPIAS